MAEETGNVTGMYHAVNDGLKKQRVAFYKIEFDELVSGISLSDEDHTLMFLRYMSIRERHSHIEVVSPSKGMTRY
jgi:hypothetical protein